MQRKGVVVIPYCDHGEMVCTGSELLKYVVAHIARVLPGMFGLNPEQPLGFLPPRWRDVDVCDGIQRAACLWRGCRINCETLVHALILRAVVNFLENRPELKSARSRIVSLKQGLILPCFHDNKAVRPEYFPKRCRLQASFRPWSSRHVLFQGRYRLFRGVPLNINVSDDVGHSICMLIRLLVAANVPRAEGHDGHVTFSGPPAAAKRVGRCDRPDLDGRFG